MRRRKPSLQIGTSTCPACGQPCLVRVVDNGWDYEYGSERGTYHQYDPVSDCCEEPLSDDSITWEEMDYE